MRTHHTRKRLIVASGLAVVVASLLTLAYRLTLLSTAQLRSTDFLFVASADRHARATVIVGVDQHSYRQLLPQYGAIGTWPRTLYAQAVDRLSQAGARVIVLDLFFDASQPEDPELAAAMQRAANVLTPVEAQGPRTVHPSPGVAQEFEAFVRPTATIHAAAAGEGLVNVTMDQDSVIRSLPVVLRAGQEDMPTLALTAVARFLRRPVVLDEAPTDATIYAAGRATPLLASSSMLINFLGPPSSPERDGPFIIIPFVDVVTGAFDPTVVQDKIVLIGLTIHGMDEFATPSTARVRMWGVEVLGNTIETILAQRYLMPLSSGLTITLMAGLALVASLGGALWRPLSATGGIVLLLLAYVLVASLLFDAGLLVNMIYPPLAILLAFATTLVYRVGFEQAAQRRLRGVMARYLSPPVCHWVLQDPERLHLGGETRTMTVLFADLRGFTALAHSLEPQALVALLNAYMTAMTAIIFKHDGVLDKFIGDAIMAFWNAPMGQEDHARRACETALDMLARFHTLQAEWARRGWPRLDMGIGINTGPMVVGNMGSRDRLTYTVIGDTVNVASRLEGLTKEYGTRIVIGDSTRLAAGDGFLYRFLDRVVVQGRSAPLMVYELSGRAGQLDAAHAMLLERYTYGIELYQQRQWAEAVACFQALLAAAADDGPSALYLRRSQDFLKEGPPADWDGVYVAKMK